MRLLASDHAIAKSGENCEPARRGLNKNTAPVGLIRDTHHKAITLQRIQRTAHGRLAEAERLSESAHSVRAWI
jgi:hypothetical protein